MNEVINVEVHSIMQKQRNACSVHGKEGAGILCQEKLPKVRAPKDCWRKQGERGRSSRGCGGNIGEGTLIFSVGS